ncbi:hypothetical protein HME9302_00779 [Alteripontixanthobacter maritimus]|uniref:Uncharacterized protein n=1 Tax=Alteripontixanthobacter maritimus TaxID=2161824 RepID=A0A369Q9K3_9SPHN|nr:hypothetical protein HME9302_00779 [Alteripontixanthobacter maritimus]
MEVGGGWPYLRSGIAPGACHAFFATLARNPRSIGGEQPPIDAKHNTGTLSDGDQRDLNRVGGQLLVRCGMRGVQAQAGDVSVVAFQHLDSPST